MDYGNSFRKFPLHFSICREMHDNVKWYYPLLFLSFSKYMIVGLSIILLFICRAISSCRYGPGIAPFSPNPFLPLLCQRRSFYLGTLLSWRYFPGKAYVSHFIHNTPPVIMGSYNIGRATNRSLYFRWRLLPFGISHGIASTSNKDFLCRSAMPEQHETPCVPAWL